jgi:hypothetical protein
MSYLDLENLRQKITKYLHPVFPSAYGSNTKIFVLKVLQSNIFFIFLTNACKKNSFGVIIFVMAGFYNFLTPCILNLTAFPMH